jgi:uncharacterized membrane protein
MSQSARWTLVVIVLAPAIVLPLVVGLYDRSDPELFGFPFYYWFQFALIPMAAICTSIAYQLTKHEHPPARSEDDPTAGPRIGHSR